MPTINHLSEILIRTVKLSQDYQEILEELAQYPLQRLKEELHNDDLRKAFWINSYNAFFLIFRRERGIQKPHIYRQKLVTIAGEKLSLDEIEHGILRRFRYKFSRGYLANPFARRLVKQLALRQIDFRIHFALNCGAQSCPPIAFYTANKINEQLEMATLSFLESETLLKPGDKEIHISRLFHWYLGDFGGKSGIRNMLQKYLQLDSKGCKLIYKQYSWKEDLENYDEKSFVGTYPDQ
ncbi:MAG: DUF547 domain-containing protein [Bacteroidota bacterium]